MDAGTRMHEKNTQLNDECTISLVLKVIFMCSQETAIFDVSPNVIGRTQKSHFSL